MCGFIFCIVYTCKTFKNTLFQKHIETNFNKQTRMFRSVPKMYFQLCSYIQNFTLKLRKIRITTNNTKHTNNDQTHFRKPIFQKYISLGLLGPLWIAFELTN